MAPPIFGVCCRAFQFRWGNDLEPGAVSHARSPECAVDDSGVRSGASYILGFFSFSIIARPCFAPAQFVHEVRNRQLIGLFFSGAFEPQRNAVGK